jgi:uncharacterized protein Smg (DUF494 family)
MEDRLTTIIKQGIDKEAENLKAILLNIGLTQEQINKALKVFVELVDEKFESHERRMDRHTAYMCIFTIISIIMVALVFNVHR